MSEVCAATWIHDYVFTPYGEVYEDLAHFGMDRPLDTGRLLYVKLVIEFRADFEFKIEVWFDHFDNTITAQIARGEDVREVTFYDEQMARSVKLAYVHAIIADSKGAFE